MRLVDEFSGAFHANHVPSEIIVCYHAEGREGEILDLHWQMPQEAAFQVDAFREDDRIFTAQISYQQVSTE